MSRDKQKTIIDVLQEATIDDDWNINESTSPPEGHMRVQGRLTKTQVTARLGKYLARNKVKHVEKLLAQSHKYLEKEPSKLDAGNHGKVIGNISAGDTHKTCGNHQSATIGSGDLHTKGSFTGDRWTQLTHW